MVSARLDGMITDPISRTYLTGIDGVWADLVLSEFAFLEQRGGALDFIVFHQKNSTMSYSGPWGDVVLEFAPDSDPFMWLGGHVDLRGPSSTYKGDFDRLMRQRRPGTTLPRLRSHDTAGLAATLRAWADVLQSAINGL